MINSTVAEPSGFNCKARRASRVQFPSLGSHVSKAVLPLYSKPRGYRSRQLVTHEDRVSVL